jgi:hypothetical protein
MKYTSQHLSSPLVSFCVSLVAGVGGCGLWRAGDVVGHTNAIDKNKDTQKKEGRQTRANNNKVQTQTINEQSPHAREGYVEYILDLPLVRAKKGLAHRRHVLQIYTHKLKYKQTQPHTHTHTHTHTHAHMGEADRPTRTPEMSVWISCQMVDKQDYGCDMPWETHTYVHTHNTQHTL